MCEKMAWFLEDFDRASACREDSGAYTEAVRFLVGRVAVSPAYRSHRHKQRHDWVPVRRRDAEKFFGRSANWGEIRTDLLKHGVLECDEEYQTDVKAKWYRLGRGWRRRIPKMVVLSDKKLAAYAGQCGADRKDARVWKPVHEHLARCLRDVRVDEPLASSLMEHQKQERGRHLTQLKIAVIQSGEASLIVCPYSRVHSPVVNLSGIVRPALRIHGQPLDEVDVANCQPLLLGYMAAKLWSREWSEAGVRRLGKRGRCSNPFDGLPMDLWQGELPSDLRDYLEVCERGEFYESLIEAWERHSETRMERSEFKPQVFRYILFGPVLPEEPLWIAFKSRWPSMAEVLELLKRRDYGTTSRHANASNLI